MPPHHLSLHGVIVGMTGSGKTGLATVLVEEALRARVPVLMIDIKGDLPNLLLALPSFEPEALLPWAGGLGSPGDERSESEVIAAVAKGCKDALAAWKLSESDVARFREQTRFRVITPGSTAGEPLHVLSSLERRSPRWDSDPEAARAALSAAISLLLRLLGREPDPAKSKEHVLLSVLAERRLRAGESSDLAKLLADVNHPPIDHVGALTVDAFLSKRDRRELAAALNGLLASPTFEGWRSGATLDPGAWLTPGSDGRTPAVIVSVAHLDDEERSLVLGVLPEEMMSWVRSLPSPPLGNRQRSPTQSLPRGTASCETVGLARRAHAPAPPGSTECCPLGWPGSVASSYRRVLVCMDEHHEGWTVHPANPDAPALEVPIVRSFLDELPRHVGA